MYIHLYMCIYTHEPLFRWGIRIWREARCVHSVVTHKQSQNWQPGCCRRGSNPRQRSRAKLCQTSQEFIPLITARLIFQSSVWSSYLHRGAWGTPAEDRVAARGGERSNLQEARSLHVKSRQPPGRRERFHRGFLLFLRGMIVGLK